MATTTPSTTKRAKCPSCDTGFTYPANRPQRFCSTGCRKAASNARRVPTGRSPGRPRGNSDARTPISTHQNSEAAPAAIPANPLRHRGGPASIGDRIRIWLDHSALGSGERYLIVAEIGRAQVSLYSAALMAEVTIGRSEFEQHAEPYDSDPEAVLAILERNLESYARAGLDHDKLPESVIKALTAEASSLLPQLSTKELASCH